MHAKKRGQPLASKIHKLALVIAYPFYYVLSLPFYIKRQILPFVLLSSRDAEEVTVFGLPRGGSGLDYWGCYAKRVRSTGVFGLDTRQYLGVPYGVHVWPFTLFVFSRLRFNQFFLLCAGMIALAVIWLTPSVGVWQLWWLPLVFLSTFLLFNISAATWELLAWGCGLLGLSAFHNGHCALSGTLYGLALLAHPGVFFCNSIIAALLLLPGAEIKQILSAGISGTLIAGWFLIPYFRSRDKLGREESINIEKSRSFANSELWLMAAWTLFSGTLAASSQLPLSQILLLLFPLVVIIVNCKWKMIFSFYTVLNLMAVTGAISLAFHPELPAIIAYLYVINTSPRMVFPDYIVSGFKSPLPLHPVFRQHERRAFLREMMEAVPDMKQNRIALQGESEYFDRYLTASLTSMLVTGGYTLVNGFYAEIGDSKIKKNFSDVFSEHSSIDAMQKACIFGGCSHIVAFTKSFSNHLSANGFCLVRTIHSVHLSHINDEQRDVYVHATGCPTVFAIGGDFANIGEQSPLEAMEQGRFSVFGKPESECTVMLSCYKGWRAVCKGRNVPICDDGPGLKFVFPDSADEYTEVEFSYSYLNYFRISGGCDAG